MTLTVGSLFAGIGGFDLGLERAGMRVIWQSEIDHYASAVLKKHWPNVPNHGDIRTITADRVERPDVLCGGFPCQDISASGKGAGIDDGERSGLWREYARIIRDLRPRYAVMENVAALTYRGLGRVVGDLADVGYDAEWFCLPASAAGAPHKRERIWIVAYPHGERRGNTPLGFDAVRLLECEAPKAFRVPELPEPPICGVDDGLPDRSHRLRALGNAIVPQIAEIIGRAILDHDTR